MITLVCRPNISDRVTVHGIDLKPVSGDVTTLEGLVRILRATEIIDDAEVLIISGKDELLNSMAFALRAQHGHPPMEAYRKYGCDEAVLPHLGTYFGPAFPEVRDSFLKHT